MSKFNIGDEVRVTNTNESGVVTDKMYSEAYSHFLYIIKPNNGGRSIMREESRLERIDNGVYFKQNAKEK